MLIMCFDFRYDETSKKEFSVHLATSIIIEEPFQNIIASSIILIKKKVK